MSNNHEQTLAPHYHKLSKIDRLLILRAVTLSEDFEYEVHLGLLPFLSAAKVMAAVEDYLGLYATSRLHATLKRKLHTIYQSGNEHIPFLLFLNDKKVQKILGAHPERGIKIPMAQKKRVTVGVRWSLPHRDHIPDDDVLVAPYMVLKKGPAGRWWVYCEPKHRYLVTQYLIDTCL